MSETPAPDTALDYEQYLTRFERLVGELQIGQYGRFKGRLVPKLDDETHADKVESYLEIGQRFAEMISRGDTIDDSLAVDLRTAEIELILEKSLFMPSFD